MEAVGMKKGGPLLGKLTAALMDWQLAHPNASKADCQAWLRKEHASLIHIKRV